MLLKLAANISNVTLPDPFLVAQSIRWANAFFLNSSMLEMPWHRLRIGTSPQPSLSVQDQALKQRFRNQTYIHACHQRVYLKRQGDFAKRGCTTFNTRQFFIASVHDFRYAGVHALNMLVPIYIYISYMYIHTYACVHTCA